MAPDPFLGITAVSFDVDGTLYSDRALSAAVAAESLRCALAGHPAESLRELRRLRRFRREVELLRADRGLLPAGWRSGIARRLESETLLLLPAIRRIGPAAGVRALLNGLRVAGRIAVAVSDFESAPRIAALGLGECFDRIYAAEALGVLKPDAGVFRQAAADLRIPAGALLHLGNRPDTDGRAALAAGCRSLILGRDFPSFGELLRFIPPPTGADRTAGT